MNRKEAAIAITEEFITNFDATIPVVFDNQQNCWLCTSPLTYAEKPTDSPWVKFSVVDNTTPSSTFGNQGARRFNRLGFVSANVYVPENEGTSEGRDICEVIISIFEGKRISEKIMFNYGDIADVGNIDSGWYLFNVTVYYSFDETK